MSPALRVRRLPVNAAWSLIFGEQLLPVDGRRLYQLRADLVAACERTGLTVRPDGSVTSDASSWRML